MLNGLTNQPIKLQKVPEAPAFADILQSQADAVKSLLESNQIRCWISESGLRIEGRPREATIVISQNSDHLMAQRILDSAP